MLRLFYFGLKYPAPSLSGGSADGKPQDGWTKLPNGLIFQWGTTYSSWGNSHHVTLPIPFPNQMLAGYLCDTGAPSWPDCGRDNNTIFNYSKTGFDMFNLDTCGSGYQWLAIGY